MRDAGASHVLFVEGSRNDYGFSLDITLRGVAGEDSEKAQGWCNFCTGPQMVTAAENVARPLVVHLAARPDPRSRRGLRRPRHQPERAGGEGRAARRMARVLLGAGLAAVGAAAVVIGSVIVESRGRPGRLRAPERFDLPRGLRRQEPRHRDGRRRRPPGRRRHLSDAVHQDTRRSPSARRRRGGREVLVERFGFALAIALVGIACNPKSLRPNYCRGDTQIARSPRCAVQVHVRGDAGRRFRRQHRRRRRG